MESRQREGRFQGHTRLRERSTRGTRREVRSDVTSCASCATSLQFAVGLATFFLRGQTGGPQLESKRYRHLAFFRDAVTVSAGDASNEAVGAIERKLSTDASGKATALCRVGRGIGREPLTDIAVAKALDEVLSTQHGLKEWTFTRCNGIQST